MVTATSIPNPVIAMLNGSYAGILNMVRLQTDTHTLVRTEFGTLKMAAVWIGAVMFSKCPPLAA
jgi:hypothetical protein